MLLVADGTDVRSVNWTNLQNILEREGFLLSFFKFDVGNH